MKDERAKVKVINSFSLQGPTTCALRFPNDPSALSLSHFVFGPLLLSAVLEACHTGSPFSHGLFLFDCQALRTLAGKSFVIQFNALSFACAQIRLSLACRASRFATMN